MKIKKCLLEIITILLFLTGCKNDSIKEIDLNDIVECGTYYSTNTESDEYIEILEDDYIQLYNFDGEHIADIWSEAIENEKITKDEFIDNMNNPYKVTIREDDIDGTYKIRIPMYGEESSCRMIMRYNSESGLLIFGENDFRMQVKDNVQ